MTVIFVTVFSLFIGSLIFVRFKFGALSPIGISVLIFWVIVAAVLKWNHRRKNPH
jgi:hypothetical protein